MRRVSSLLKLFTPTRRARFWKKVRRRGDDDCWLWEGKIEHKGQGYGRYHINDKGTHYYCGAHRVAYELTYGETDKYVCHKCNVKACVNPKHLYAGTPADNLRQAAEDGLMPRGERVKGAKLSADAVRRILLESHRTAVEFAREYNVSPGAILSVRRRVTWRHIDVSTVGERI